MADEKADNYSTEAVPNIKDSSDMNAPRNGLWAQKQVPDGQSYCKKSNLGFYVKTHAKKQD